MSSIRDIREISNERLSKFAWQLAKKFFASQTKNQTDKLEGALDIYSSGQDVYSVVKYHSLNSTKYFGLGTTYYLPMEPDGHFVTCMIKGKNMGNTTRDFSSFGNHAELHGDPLLMDGTPFDYGIHTGGALSTCIRFNRPTSTELGYISIPDAGNLGLIGLATGYSDFIRFRLKSLAQQGNQTLTLIEKADNDSQDDARMVQVTTEGRIIYVVRTSGTSVVLKQTATGILDTDIVYGMFTTYTISGNVAHIYLWNDETQSPTVTDLTLSNYTGQVNWHSTVSNHDLNIFRRGEGSNGHVYGDFYDYRYYHGKVISSTEAQNLADNKLTITDIPFGEVQVENYWAMPFEVSAPSFDSDDFASDSFDV